MEQKRRVADRANIRPIKYHVLGQRFGRLQAVGPVYFKLVKYGQKRRWLESINCICDCGKQKIILKTCLLNNQSTSCGCYIKEINSKHGLHKHPLYIRWSDMKARCRDVNYKQYADYGGRGIDVCPEWKNDFMAFYNWSIHAGFSKELTLERKDNSKNYAPDNCKWATWKEQGQNKRNSKKYLFEGEMQTVSVIAEKLNMLRSSADLRLKKGFAADTIKDVILKSGVPKGRKNNSGPQQHP